MARPTNVQNPIADFFVIQPEGNDTTGPTFECILQYCVKSYETGVVSGTATTRVHENYTAESLGITLAPFGEELNFEDGGDNMVLPLVTPSENASYGSPVEMVLALQIFLGLKLPGYIDIDQYTISSDSVQSFNLALQGNNPIVDIGNILNNLACAMTNEMRTTTSGGSSNGVSSITEVTNGTAYENITYISVNWEWLTFLIT